MVKRLAISLVLCLFFLTPLQAELTTAPVAIESSIDLMKVFQSCPIIYILLFLMSFSACILWLYSLFTFRLSDMMPTVFMMEIRSLLAKKQFDKVLLKCEEEKHFSSLIISSGLLNRKHGPQVMIEMMQAEGRRYANLLWQRIAFLNEIAVIAPMLGLLGTVLGLFFAFYDSNRSTESITALFDGLGIAVGTTVVGLVVAILAMIFYTMLKFRLVKLMHTIENESLSLVSLIETENLS